MTKYDLIIIGGGAGAFGAAIRANELQAKTAMINSGLPLGVPA
jgi:pyruvate/2-oxoglutarate dehydrogenase complex dihydrolipoamide dehydrogenase (E3) component